MVFSDGRLLRLPPTVLPRGLLGRLSARAHAPANRPASFERRNPAFTAYHPPFLMPYNTLSQSLNVP